MPILQQNHLNSLRVASQKSQQTPNNQRLEEYQEKTMPPLPPRKFIYNQSSISSLNRNVSLSTEISINVYFLQIFFNN